MYEAQLAELHEFFPKERVLFYYFKDRYALMLLAHAIGPEGKRIGEIKQSQFKGFLNKPLLKALTKQCVSGRLTQADLLNIWPQETIAYRLTLGEWGGRKNWHGNQTSRSGKNVVLQLNFSNQHNASYYQLLRPNNDDHLFQFNSHPITTAKGQHTLAWARIDLSLEDGEALIEEVQNDWLREVFETADWIRSSIRRGTKPDQIKQSWGFWPRQFNHYIETAVAPHLKLWNEAMLTAAIWYLKEELGISRIFYHSFESGNRLKHLNWSKPPRSLYTKLPRRFGFTQTAERPLFLDRSWNRPRRKQMQKNRPIFYLLDI